jgi:MHS family alpha-ketoglutarate permease-like MFS transporter
MQMEWGRGKIIQHGVRLFLYEVGATLTDYTCVRAS